MHALTMWLFTRSPRGYSHLPVTFGLDLIMVRFRIYHIYRYLGFPVPPTSVSPKTPNQLHV